MSLKVLCVRVILVFFVVVDSCLSEFSCILRFNSDPSVSEVIVRVFEIEDVFMLSHLKDLAHSFGLK